jgi:hypothetical protein
MFPYRGGFVPRPSTECLEFNNSPCASSLSHSLSRPGQCKLNSVTRTGFPPTQLTANLPRWLSAKGYCIAASGHEGQRLFELEFFTSTFARNVAGVKICYSPWCSDVVVSRPWVVQHERGILRDVEVIRLVSRGCL